MIPKNKEWGSWSSIDKVTYIAQLLVPFTLLITVIFSYFGWREAKLSRIAQNTYFSAQHSPNLVADVRFTRPELPTWVLTLTNNGDSTALNVCVYIREMFGNHVYRDTCEDDERIFSNFSVGKGDSIEYPIILASEFEKVIGFLPEETMILKKFDSLPNTYHIYLTVIVTYKNAIGDEHVELITVAFKDDVKPKSKE
ncbi:MAG: hypothetical protein HQ521_11535 [Bacteroidetes bacterium]|nr:hypothetical protein [Bacteroidota bacterium]